MNKKLLYISGFICGVINGLLGAGGGMIIVPTLIKHGLGTKEAHATSVCIILPICLLSAVMYLQNNKVTLYDALPFIPFGIIGSFLGGKLLQKLRSQIIKKIFACLMLWAAIKMLF